ncbi:ClpP/crotonase, partial [Clavulina sp. PMI_390]
PLATLHHPHPHLWELEMHNGPKNILTPFFMTVCLLKALNIVERDWRSQHGVASGGPGALVISGKRDQEQYFSAGKSYCRAELSKLYPYIASFAPALVRLLTFPMPTIAALNGHTFGAGFALALCCDYRIMQTSNGWCGMGEIFAGTSLGSIFSAILQCKLPSVLLKRSIPLEGRKFKAKEMHDLGVVDVMAENGGAAIEAARQLALERADLARTGVWGINK